MRLPTSQELKKILPLDTEYKNQIISYRKTIQEILTGQDPRIALVVGPCSIHNPESALEYAHLLKELSKQVEKTCFIVMRSYIEKPRTTTGWKGYLYDPFLDGSNNILEGLHLSRKLLLDLASIGIPLATEFLDPMACGYFEDLISWGFIGARTCSSSTHRQLASALEIPVGFKNSTDGNIENAVHGILAARAPHPYITLDTSGHLFAKQSKGNFSTHIVLRGSTFGPNYDAASVQGTMKRLSLDRISTRILIDCSHGNCGKQQERQPEVFYNILEQIVRGNTKIMGMMLESHLESGNQPLSEDTSSIQSSVSVTDPCIDWSSTKELILSADEGLSSPSSLSSTISSDSF